jgi:nucleotide-binding universal stress UspA family protein
MVTPVEHKIIVGVDGSESSISALTWAARQAELTGAELETITTWEWPAAFGWAAPLPEGWDPRDDAQEVIDEVLAPIKKAHPDVVVRVTLAEGHPAPVLVRASAEAELLVVGSRGHGEFAGMLLGSVSEHCVANAHCPVVVVRNFPAEAPT